ncbi:MAG: hypothetical protein LBT50_09845 [Prevotellaceae bacterium]|jgi:hypothetical protein|nr:hypothetical protein [Prevotellaceae bacterium]
MEIKLEVKVVMDDKSKELLSALNQFSEKKDIKVGSIEEIGFEDIFLRFFRSDEDEQLKIIKRIVKRFNPEWNKDFFDKISTVLGAKSVEDLNPENYIRLFDMLLSYYAGYDIFNEMSKYIPF